MKRIGLLVVLVVLLAGLSGCAGWAYIGGKPRFHNTTEYEKNEKIDFSGSATADDVAKMLNQKEDLRQRKELFNLATAKLNSQPAVTETKNGAPQGYKGIVANFANYRANIVLKNMQTGIPSSYVLEAGARAEDNLIPGEYEATTFVGGEMQGSSKRFTVGAPQYQFLGEKVHWFVYYDPRALQQKNYDRW